MSKRITLSVAHLKVTELGDTLLNKRVFSANTPLTIVCHKCNNEFKSTYASYRTKKEGGCRPCNTLKGSAHPNHRNLSSDERQSRKDRLTNHRVLLKSYLATNDNRCFITGLTTKQTKLSLHHLNNWAQFPEQREDVNNTVLITKSLHEAFHKLHGHSTTAEQFFTFAKQVVLLKTI